MFARVCGAGSRRVSAAEEKLRRRLLRGLTGRVLEVGPGAGTNFDFYPPEVTEVLAVEPEPHLRRLAIARAAAAGVAIRVVEGVAEALPVADAEFDAAVVSLVLCSVMDQARALAELMRAIRPGGELRYYEHVVAEGRIAAAVQRALDATVWPVVAGGCHCARDTRAAIVAAGFVIESDKRLSFRPLGVPLPVSPQLAGTARRP